MEHWIARNEAVVVYALLGDRDAALKHLEAVQAGPRPNCDNYLRLAPELRSLRDDPRFEAAAKKSSWPR